MVTRLLFACDFYLQPYYSPHKEKNKGLHGLNIDYFVSYSRLICHPNLSPNFLITVLALARSGAGKVAHVASRMADA